MQIGGMELTMHSRDWQIRPAVYKEKIDGRNVRMLGYDYTEVPDDGWTELRLSRISPCHEAECRECLFDFFYPENPLFGECISSAPDVQAYFRSNLPIPCDQHAPNLKGILYVNNLAAGRLDLPFVINIREDIYDRGRKTLEEFDTAELLHRAVQKLDPEASLKLLEKLYVYWNDLPKRLFDYETKYYLICCLVRNVADDQECTRMFREKHQNLCYMERTTGDTVRNGIIAETREWAQGQKIGRYVNPIFRLLGAASVVGMYLDSAEKDLRPPTEKETERMKIVFDALRSVSRAKLQPEMPELMIDTSGGVFRPLQFSERKYGRRTVKYRIDRLAMAEADFEGSAFQKTFLKVAGAMFHNYGTDSSRNLTILLTDLGGWMIESSTLLKQFEDAWNKC